MARPSLPKISPRSSEGVWQRVWLARVRGLIFSKACAASHIGTECERAIWYAFRWATRARHTGRLLRLFDTGNLAEARFVADLPRV
jgi:hypothetical protein